MSDIEVRELMKELARLGGAVERIEARQTEHTVSIHNLFTVTTSLQVSLEGLRGRILALAGILTALGLGGAGVVKLIGG